MYITKKVVGNGDCEQNMKKLKQHMLVYKVKLLGTVLFQYAQTDTASITCVQN